MTTGNINLIWWLNYILVLWPSRWHHPSFFLVRSSLTLAFNFMLYVKLEIPAPYSCLPNLYRIIIHLYTYYICTYIYIYIYIYIFIYIRRNIFTYWTDNKYLFLEISRPLSNLNIITDFYLNFLDRFCE